MTLKELKEKKVGFISLGCDKNRVDLEKMIFAFSNAGFEIVNSYEEANIIVINTCAFILDARKESVNTILETIPLKQLNLEKLIVTGCLNNLNFTDLKESMPEVDAFVPLKENEHIVEIVANLYGVKTKGLSSDMKENGRVLTTPKHYAYLKIADGCDNFCTYCTIPYIRGRYKSEPMDKVLKEANNLVKNGTKEIILVAQDVTKYGADFAGKPQLVELLQELSKIEGLNKIRLLYCYPDLIDDRLINEIASNNKVAKYIDIPLQHISNNILKRMNRRVNKEQILNIIAKLRHACPDIRIRSTFILGFPGETSDDFNELLDFIKTEKLDYVGFFKYSKEEGTPASKMPNQVPAKVKTERLKLISNAQFEVVKEKNKHLIGKTFDCVLDFVQNGNAYFRSEYLCPLVDPIIVTYDRGDLKVGKYYKVKIVDYKKYDLIGELLWIYQIE